jgi:hypothetical protein
MMTTRLATFLALLASLALTGCSTLQIPLGAAPPVEELPTEARPGVYGVLIDPVFENYTASRLTPISGHVLRYELGAASKQLLLDTLKLAVQDVVLVDGRPPFAEGGSSRIQYTIYPQIRSFSASRWALFKGGEYVAKVTYFVTVYDPKGRVAMEKNYAVKGTSKGKTMAEHTQNFSSPVESAMRRAMVELVRDLARLPSPEP